MEIQFADKDLQRLYIDAKFAGGWSRAVVKAFRKRVTSIQAAKDERDIRNVKGNHFEKLQGREDEYSVRLNDQWRLIMTFDTKDNVKTVELLRIEDYH